MVYVVKNNDKYSIRKLTGAEYDAMNPLKLDIVKLMAFKKQLIENEEHLITMKGNEYLKLPIMLHDKIMKEYTDKIGKPYTDEDRNKIYEEFLEIMKARFIQKARKYIYTK